MNGWLEALREARGGPWHSVGTGATVGASLGFALVAVIAATSTEGWVPLLDGVNLVFHEAGHPLFGLFGWETLGILGGTLMQLLVPLIVTGSFALRRDALGVAVGGFWLSENLLNIARYVGDARAQILPLVGGGEHDWATLLGQWGGLAQDQRIAGALRAIGWLGMLAAWVWLLWQWRRTRAEA